MRTLEAATEAPTTLIQFETAEATLARLVEITNQHAPTASRPIVPRFDAMEVPVANYQPVPHPAAAPGYATQPSFDWWAAARKPAVQPQAAAVQPEEVTEEVATVKTSMSSRLHEHLLETGDSYKGIRRNKEPIRQRLAHVGRRLGCLVLGTATAFAGIDTLISHQ